MAYCSNCGQEVADSANFCEKCGTATKKVEPQEIKLSSPVSNKKSGQGHPLVWGLVIFGTIITLMVVGDLSRSGRKQSQQNELAELRDYLNTRYAHQTVNIRSGPGKGNPVVGKIERGDVVKINSDSAKGDWAPVIQNDSLMGYVFSSLLKTYPIPDFEIVDWSWYRDPDFGGDGAVIFTFELRNNTLSFRRAVQVEFTTYDAADRILDTQFTFARSLSPGGTASGKGYADYFGREKTAKIRVVR